MLNEKFFSIVRVHNLITIPAIPATTDTPAIPEQICYSWSAMSSEILDQDGYDRWMSLRTNGSLTEYGDVYIRKDLVKFNEEDRNINESYVSYTDSDSSDDYIDFGDIPYIKFRLYYDLRTKLDSRLSEYKIAYESSEKTQDDWDLWQSNKMKAINSINEELATFLRTSSNHYEKLDISNSGN